MRQVTFPLRANRFFGKMKMVFHKKNNFKKSGFTIIELIVSIFIFSLVMTAAVGSTLSILAANQQAEAVKSVVGNFTFAIESIVRNLRLGSDYRCGPPKGNSYGACPSWPGASNGSPSITFTDSDGNPSGYQLVGSTIQKKVGDAYIDITSPEVFVDLLYFNVDGNNPSGDKYQPNVVISVVGHAEFNNKNIYFRLETMAAQRTPDATETTTN